MMPRALIELRQTPALVVNLTSPGVAWVGRERLFLSPMQWELLTALAQRPGLTCSRGYLFSRLWPDPATERHDDSLDEHVRKLSRKLQPHVQGHSGAACIRLIRGCGYMLDVPAERVEFIRGEGKR